MSTNYEIDAINDARIASFKSRESLDSLNIDYDVIGLPYTYDNIDNNNWMEFSKNFETNSPASTPEIDSKNQSKKNNSPPHRPIVACKKSGSSSSYPSEVFCHNQLPGE